MVALAVKIWQTLGTNQASLTRHMIHTQRVAVFPLVQMTQANLRRIRKSLRNIIRRRKIVTQRKKARHLMMTAIQIQVRIRRMIRKRKLVNQRKASDKFLKLIEISTISKLQLNSLLNKPSLLDQILLTFLTLHLKEKRASKM